MALHLYAAVLYEKQNSGATALDQPAKQKESVRFMRSVFHFLPF